MSYIRLSDDNCVPPIEQLPSDGTMRFADEWHVPTASERMFYDLAYGGAPDGDERNYPFFLLDMSSNDGDEKGVSSSKYNCGIRANRDALVGWLYRPDFSSLAYKLTCGTSLHGVFHLYRVHRDGIRDLVREVFDGLYSGDDYAFPLPLLNSIMQYHSVPSTALFKDVPYNTCPNELKWILEGRVARPDTAFVAVAPSTPPSSPRRPTNKRKASALSHDVSRKN